MSTNTKMNIHEAHEYAECLSSDIAELIPNYPILKEYFGSVWDEINAKEKTYIKLKKGEIREVIKSGN